MFWKKQNNKTEIIFYGENQNQRNAFRYKPEGMNCPRIIFLGKSVKLIDISASGTSFKAKGFAAGDVDNAQLDLNEPDTKRIPLMSLKIKILSINNRTGICRCCFENITEEQKEILHHYILNKQKAAIRENKKRDTSH